MFREPDPWWLREGQIKVGLDEQGETMSEGGWEGGQCWGSSLALRRAWVRPAREHCWIPQRRGSRDSDWLHFKHGDAREAASTPRDWLWLLRQKHRHNMLPPFTFHTLPNISAKAAIKRNKISFKHLSSFQMFHLHKLFCCAYLHICHLHKDSLLNIFKIYCGWYSAAFNVFMPWWYAQCLTTSIAQALASQNKY